MKRRLYANTKRITTIFVVSIISLTLLLLVLRLSLFKEMASAPEINVETTTGNQLTYSFNRKIYFASPTAAGNVLIESDEASSCYMRLIIVDPDTLSTLLDTGKVEPGKKINAAPLSRSAGLATGEYDCIAQVIAYDMETSEILNQEEHPVTLYVGIKPPPNDPEDSVRGAEA